jgi:hypothetical protein
MKRRRGVGRSVPVATLESLRGMPTKALLARVARLRFCEQSLGASDMTPEEAQTADGILFKDTAEWKNAFDDLKLVLAEREHVPRPNEKRAAREPWRLMMKQRPIEKR